MAEGLTIYGTFDESNLEELGERLSRNPNSYYIFGSESDDIVSQRGSKILEDLGNYLGKRVLINGPFDVSEAIEMQRRMKSVEGGIERD